MKTIISPSIDSRQPTVAVAICGLVAIMAFCGCGNSGEQEVAAQGAPPAPPPQLVRLGQISIKTVSPKLTVVGSIVPSRTSIVASGSNGQVEEYLAEEGSFVEEGTVLSVLKMVTTDLEIEEAKALLAERQQALEELENGSRKEEIVEARARMQAHLAAKESTQSRLERIRTLIARQASNQDELDEAEERAEAASQLYLASQAQFELIVEGPRKETIEQARARVKGQQDHVEFLLADKQKRITRAPFSGFVVEEHSHEGQWLSQGDPVVTLVELNAVDVVGNVNQDDIKHVRLGSESNIKISAVSDDVWQGRVSYIVPTSDWKAGSRGFPVKVRLQNQFTEVDGVRSPILKAGMMAEMTLFGAPQQALMAPKDALMRTTRGLLMYVCDIDKNDPTQGVVRQISLTTGLTEGNEIEVIAPELQDHQFVVVEGAERLQPFQPVRIQFGTEEKTIAPPASPPAKQPAENP
ncbi:MAG: efflux RND transporter periplasmic adaptor subunit [Planctomycetota bacterium]|nr:efflux RND transporter periplasmic adaptor subunit [Planctomycetota bacterium]MDA1214420.1 efflux RND transporter periplasmic adaptor subunit [Planctomycetota bacterium]